MPFGKAHWPCLMPLNTGEIHARWTGKPGAGQKVFCPGAQTEQSKHEGIIWFVHGKCWSATLECGKERKVNGERKKHQKNLFCDCGLSRLRLAKEYVKQDCTCTVHLFVWEGEIVFGGTNGEGAPRQVSSLLTQTVISNIGKVCPRGVLYFSNDTPLVRLSRVYDLYK